jgi:Domain of unknown function (DUF1918)
MKAKQGDQILIGSNTPNQKTRRGQVLEHGTGEAGERYVVRWQDGHESIYLSGPDGRVLELH